MAPFSAARGAGLWRRGGDVGQGKVVADKQQRAASFTGERIRETIAKVEPGRVRSLSPLLAGATNGFGRFGIDGYDFELQMCEEVFKRLGKSAARRNNLRLGQRSR